MSKKCFDDYTKATGQIVDDVKKEELLQKVRSTKEKLRTEGKDFDTNIGFLRQAFWQIIMAAGPILAIALAVGLVIVIVQAATSINEMTLSFVPKLVIVVASLALLSNFMMLQLTDYFAFVFDQITRIG